MNPKFESFKRTLEALSSLTVVAIVAYFIVLVNVLIHIWCIKFKNPRERNAWFVFVLVLSPIGIPLYLYKLWTERGETDAGENAQDDSLDQQPAKTHAKRPGLSAADRERELARLLQMKKNGILSPEEFNRAKKRLSV